jgi:hypothetical protein
MVVIETMEDFVAYSRKITAERRAVQDAKKAEVTELSGFTKNLQSIWDKSDFGCQRPHVAELFRALVKEIKGEDVVFSVAKEGVDFSYPKYSVIVPLSNPNSHSYPLNEPFLVVSKESNGRAGGLRMKNTDGNTHGGAWRYATDEEVTKFFTDMSVSATSYINERILSA